MTFVEYCMISSLHFIIVVRATGKNV